MYSLTLRFYHPLFSIIDAGRDCTPREDRLDPRLHCYRDADRRDCGECRHQRNEPVVIGCLSIHRRRRLDGHPARFDNTPLTKLALEQGGYDWGVLAFAVGYGGSMIWFGSSAGVAITNLYPEARSVAAWIKSGWHVAVGFFVMLALLGWHPHEPYKAPTDRTSQEP